MNCMLACVDVDYKENSANVACILFQDWKMDRIASVYHIRVREVLEYEPGAFYKRELPCILKVLQGIRESVELIIVDGYVWLDSNRKPGLGAYLYQAIGQACPVIGVAKSFFFEDGDLVRKVIRGKGRSPLFVTATGMDVEMAASRIQEMHGNYRLPTILGRVDQLSKQWG